jgi:hypothetical protein
MRNRKCLLLLSYVASVGALAATASARAATCESLASLSLPNITITAAQTNRRDACKPSQSRSSASLPRCCWTPAGAVFADRADRGRKDIVVADLVRGAVASYLAMLWPRIVRADLSP